MFSIFKTLVKPKPQPQKHGQKHTKFTAYRIYKIDLQPQIHKVRTLTTKDCKGPQSNMPQKVGSIKT